MEEQIIPALIPERLQAVDLYEAGTRCICVPVSLIPIIANMALELSEPIYWTGTPQNISLISAQLETYATKIMSENCDSGITDLRINGCVLEMNTGSAWVQVGSLSDCFGVPEIRQDIREFVTNYGDITVIQNLLPDTVYDENTASCDKDKLFGACSELISYMNLVIEDFFELLELHTNPLETALEMVRGMPIVDEVGLDVFIGWVQSASENMAQAYLGNYTVALQDTYKCDLFCIGLKNCTLSIDDVYEYYRERVGAGVGLGSWIDVIQFIALGNWIGQEFCDILHLFVISAMKFNNRFGDIVPNLRRFKVVIGLGALNPLPDHVALCDCPEETWCKYWLNTGDIIGLNIDLGTLTNNETIVYLIGNIIDVNVTNSTPFFASSMTIEQSGIGSGLPVVRLYKQVVSGGDWVLFHEQRHGNEKFTIDVNDMVYGLRYRGARSYNYAFTLFQVDGTGDNPILSGTKCPEQT